MNRSQAQFRRLMELDRRLRAGAYPSCRSFAREWEVSPKTVQRDINYLRDQLGAPLVFHRARRGFAYSDPRWFLPALSMSEGDLLALLVATRALEAYRGTPVARELDRIFRRLAEGLPEQVSLRPELVYNRMTFHGPPARPVEEAIWVTLVRGLVHNRTVRMTYRSLEATRPEERMMDPYHLANLQGDWYVFGWCHRRRAVRQFALPRITRIALTDRPFSVSPDYRPEDRLGPAFGKFASGANVKTVRLRFTPAAAAEVLERQWHPRQSVRRLPGGGVELTFRTDGLMEVFHWVLSWGRQVRVLSPAALRRQVRAEWRAAARA